MKYNIEIINDNIVSDLKFDESESSISFIIDNDSDVELSLKDNLKEIKLIINENIKVNLMNMIGNGKIKISYLLKPNSFLNEFVINESDNDTIIMDKHVIQMDNTIYEVSNGLFSDSNIKCDIVVDLDGLNARALHNVAAIARNNNEKDFNIIINNNNRMSYGELNNFGVVKNSATLIFNGTGYIKNGASLSQAHQESRIITFDPNIQAQANPFLIIDESDVEASHAAAVGQLDEEQLYYLQSRGIRYEDASKLITYGYLKPILNKVNDEKLKDKLENLIEKKVGI